MKVQFLQSSATATYSGGHQRGTKKSSSLFWWSMLITILAGVCSFSWFFCIYLFSHPEKPVNYQLLNKLQKLTPLVKFDRTSVPDSKGFLSPQKIYAKYAPNRLGTTHLEVTNNLLKRQYIQNYKEGKPTYFSGDFKINQIKHLTSIDSITKGIVLRGEASDYTALEIEYIIPTESNPTDIPFKIGDIFEIQGPKHFASVIHIEHLPLEKVVISLVSLLYPSINSELEQSPPKTLNLSAKWPISDRGRQNTSITDSKTESTASTPSNAPKAVPVIKDNSTKKAVTNEQVASILQSPIQK